MMGMLTAEKGRGGGEQTTGHRGAMKSTFIVAACTLVSRLMGFVRMALIGALFGAGGAADVFAVVFNIPNSLRRLLAEGALSSAFIPELSRANLEGLEVSRRLVREILALQFLIIIPLVLLAELFPAAFLALFEVFPDPEKSALAVEMFRLMAPYILLVSVGAVMMGVHHSHERFVIPAITPILFSAAVILTLIFGTNRWGPFVLGVGVLIGGMAQIFFQWPGYGRLGYTLLPLFNFREAAFLRVLRRWGPLLLTSSLFMINSWIANLLATTMAEKSVSALLYAITLWQLPFGLFAASLSTVLYPRMSREAAGGDRKALAGSLGFGYQVLFALLIPSAAVLIFLGRPITAAAYQRGALLYSDTLLIARVLGAYAAGMPFVGLFNFSQRGLYTLGKTRIPFVVGLITVFIDVALSLIFIFILDLDVAGLAWANSIAFLVGALLMYRALKKHSLFRLKGKTIMVFLKVLSATAAGSVFMLGLSRLFGAEWWSGGSSPKVFGILLLVAALTTVFILLLYKWMRVGVLSIIMKRRKGGNDES